MLDSVRLPPAPGSWAGNKEPLRVADMTIDQQISVPGGELSKVASPEDA